MRERVPFASYLFYRYHNEQTKVGGEDAPEQMVAHLTCGGADLRAGDLLGSGTVSGSERDGFGSMLELSWNGRDPVALAGGGSRTWLEDGDEVVMTATAPARDGGRVALGEVRGRVRGA